MALRVVSSQTSTQIERKQAESDLAYPFRILAANVLRTVRGAGRPDELPAMMLHCLDVLEKYRKVVGHYPKPKIYRRFLNLDAPYFDPNKWANDRELEANKQLSMSGYPERIKGELMIHRGALQVAASRLLGQHTQEVLGEHEMFQGVHLLKDSLVVSSFYWNRRLDREKEQGPIEEPPETETSD